MLPILLRICTAAALSIFLVRAALAWEEHASILLALLILGETVTVIIALLARPARQTSVNLIAILSTGAATFYFVFVMLKTGTPLIPVWIASLVQASGVLWQVAAKLTLGRSFGLLPANRGITTTGPYRIVRHPIYLGYFVAHMGFLLGNFHLKNCLLFAALYFFQGLRIWQEERLLMGDEDYRAYARRVRFRFVPGLI